MNTPEANTPSGSSLRYAAFTHRGRAHRQNQDAILAGDRVLQKSGFLDGRLPVDGLIRFAVSDGIGSQPHPATASRLLLQNLLALDAMHPALPPQLRAEKLHERMLGLLDDQPLLEDAGATLITAEATVAGIRLWHAGDSRGYRISEGQAIALTQDHTLLNTLLAEGRLTSDQADGYGESSLGQALDNVYILSHLAEPPIVSVRSFPLDPGEVLLLCSDGIPLHLEHSEIGTTLDSEDLVSGARRLFEAVWERGARDNLSAILIAC